MKKAGLKISDGVAEAMKAVEESELMRNVSLLCSPLLLDSNLDASFRRSQKRQQPSLLESRLQQLPSEIPKRTRHWLNL